MAGPSEAAAGRALALVGVHFRPQGRSAATGLDCVGLAAAAAGVSPHAVPGQYRLRGEVPDSAIGERHRVDRIAASHAGPGDILIACYAPRQHHFLVLVEGGFVHADAGLGRVVRTPGTPPWPIVSAWRVRA